MKFAFNLAKRFNTVEVNDVIQSASHCLVGKLEFLFQRWGQFVAKYPFLVIAICIVVTGISSLGLFKLNTEFRAEKLWIPESSPYTANKKWLDENYPRNTRLEFVAFESSSGNVLNRNSLLTMLNLHRNISQIKLKNNVSWETVCFRIPIANIFKAEGKPKRREKRQILEALLNLTVSAQLEISDHLGLVFSDKREEEEHEEEHEKEHQEDESGNLKESILLHSVTMSDRRSDSEATNEEEKSDAWIDYDIGDYDIYDYGEVGDEHEFEDEEKENAAGVSSAQSQKRKSASEGFVKNLSPEVYCDLVGSLQDKCLVNSILEIWNFDEDVIKNLTEQDIIDAINTVNESPAYGYEFDYVNLLGNFKRNSSGHVVSATAAMTIWVVEADPSKGLTSGSQVGVELDLADQDTLDWEEKFIETVLDMDADLVRNGEETGLRLFLNAGRSFSDIGTEAIFFDAFKMIVGYSMMFVYTMVMLGKLNWIEHRFFLTGAGILSILMGLVVAFGLSSAVGLPYTPIHAILPFLCLGIGIDDMFVIVQCWYNIESNVDQNLNRESEKSSVYKIGLAMKHAGVAITVTSLTDVFAFGIGTVTILPGLRSFCITCAIAIGSIYFLQSSWFLAWFALDQRRIDANRDGFAPCFKHKKKKIKPEDRPKVPFGKLALQKYANCLRIKMVKVFVLLVAVVLVVFGSYGCTLLRHEFDPSLLLPPDSYLREFIEHQRRNFPADGWTAEVYIGPFEALAQDLEKLDRLVREFEELAENKKVLKGVDSWWGKFTHYLSERNVTENFFDEGNIKSEEFFSKHLANFLFSPEGAKYKNKFRFRGKLECLEKAPEIIASEFTIQYLDFSLGGPDEHIPARETIEHLIQEKNFSSHAFSFSKVYAAWETDEVIGDELWINLGLAMLCVFIITLVLLANLKICLLVFLCVIMTLADMVGMIHFWGLTVDTISCINIVLAIGLCVDYSVHIAHAFMVDRGSTSMDKAVNSLVSMGPAILNGGVTTFLAVSLMGFSQSHAFIVFFKVFFLTVLFGLFHGLVFLPVVLGLLGSNNELKEEVVDRTTPTMKEEIHPNESTDDMLKKKGITNLGFVKDDWEETLGEKFSNEPPTGSTSSLPQRRATASNTRTRSQEEEEKEVNSARQ